jgi:E3 ubiquitin-protein ligase RNF14
MNAEEGLIWCKSPGCGSAQIHVSASEGNIFRCAKCGSRMCVLCENINGWHEGETCEEYQYRISGKKEAEQQAHIKASENVIKKKYKTCPNKGCGYHIEKIGGCDHMTCEYSVEPALLFSNTDSDLGQRCRHEFCWVCLVPYKKIRAHGNDQHREDCKYYA